MKARPDDTHGQASTSVAGGSSGDSSQGAVDGVSVASHNTHAAFPGHKATATLSKESQDDLCLSLEMIRHAPLHIIESVPGCELDDEGRLALPRAARSYSSDGSEASKSAAATQAHASFTAAAAAASNVNISFEAARDVRLYIDPSQACTASYFERLFCYDDAAAQSSSDSSTDLGCQAQSNSTPSYAPSVLLFSLDRSYRSILTPQSDLADVLHDPVWRNGSRNSAALSGSGVSYRGQSASESSMEAAVIAVRRTTEKGTRTELHVGRKVTRRTAVNGGAVPLTAAASATQSTLGTSKRGVRPDDPAPRGLSRVSSGNATLLKSHSHGPRRNAEFAVPLLPTRRRQTEERLELVHGSGDGGHDQKGSQVLLRQHSAPTGVTSSRRTTSEAHARDGSTERPSATKRRVGNHTPGRRGEKRARTAEGRDRGSPRVDASAEEEEEEPSMPPSVPPIPSSSKRAQSAVLPETKAPATGAVRKTGRGGSTTTAGVEERNRSLIKKLVHHQLLGKGVERHDDAYLACFGPTCQGALVALRHVAKTGPIERQQAATIVERHLDMYL